MGHRPRPYQSKGIAELRLGFAEGHRRQICVAPTGAGKTTVAALLIESAVAKGLKVDFVAHRIELLEQCSDRLASHGIDHAIEQGQRRGQDPTKQVQVVSVSTAHRRLHRRHRPDLIVIDECHRTMGATYLKYLEAYPDAAAIGLTATPWRLDGKPLGAVYSRMVVLAEPQELIDEGYLVEPQIYVPFRPDMKGVRSVGGDYRADDASRVMNNASVTGDIVKYYTEKIGATACPRAAVFATSVAHSKAIVDRFKEAGIPAGHIDSSDFKTRSKVIDDIQSGHLRVISNVGILTEGWDLPALGGVILARPTKSLTLYLQMCGRALRPFEGKERAIILDHAGCFFDHGFPQDSREYSLEKSAKKENKKGEDEEGSVTTCKVCFAGFFSKLKACPMCGTPVEKKKRRVTEDREGVLVQPDRQKEIEKKKRERLKNSTENERMATLRRCLATAKHRSYKRGWALYQYRNKYGVFPKREEVKKALRQLGPSFAGFEAA